MTTDDRLHADRFPRSNAYHPDWFIAGVSGGANPLWLTEWLSEAMDLTSGMRVLDLGCGRGLSSVFLAREFGVQVWAVDLWFDPSDRWQRVREAGVEDRVFPIRADARQLPFANDFFDAVISIDSYFYFGTDDTYLSYLMRLLKPGGQLGIAGAAFRTEFGANVPEHLKAWWEPGLSCLHSAEWWRTHWQWSGIADVERTDELPDGWQFWLQWQRVVCPDNAAELAAVEADAGRHIGYARAVCRRKPGVTLSDPITTIPSDYNPAPLLRTDG